MMGQSRLGKWWVTAMRLVSGDSMWGVMGGVLLSGCDGHRMRVGGIN